MQRYLVETTGSPHALWRFDQKRRSLSAGKVLRLEVLAAAVVHWSSDDWNTVHDTPTRDTGLGVHLADLPTEKLSAGAAVAFTFYWPEGGPWEGQDFRVAVEEARAEEQKRTDSKFDALAKNHEDSSVSPSQNGGRHVHENGGSPSPRQHEQHGRAWEPQGKSRSRQDES